MKRFSELKSKSVDSKQQNNNKTNSNDNLRKLLIKISSKNEDLTQENEKYIKHTIELIKLLEAQEKKLLYCECNIKSSNRLKNIITKLSILRNNFNNSTRQLFLNFTLWKYKSKCTNYKNNQTTNFELVYLSKASFKNIINILIKLDLTTNKQNLNYSFNKIVKYSYFSIIKAKMQQFKKILINKKLKSILNKTENKILRRNFYTYKKVLIRFDKSEFLILSNRKKDEVSIVNQRIMNISQFSLIKTDSSIKVQKEVHVSTCKFSIICKNNNLNKLAKIILRKNKNNYNLMNSFNLWKLKMVNFKYNVNKNKLNGLEIDYSTKLNMVEKTFEENLMLEMAKNQHLENELSKALRENAEFKDLINFQDNKLRNISEKGKLEDEQVEAMKNKIDAIHSNFEVTKREKEVLREKLEEYEQYKMEQDRNTKELEKRLLLLSKEKEKIINDYKEIFKNYENLKEASAKSTEELVQNYNEINRLKSERKALIDEKNNYLQIIDKLTNDLNLKDRNIRQLKMNEDSLNKQFQIDIERIENKLNSDKNNLNEKVDLLEKEKDLAYDQIKSLNREIKKLNEKLTTFNDYASIKKENSTIKSNLIMIDEENHNLKNQIYNLQRHVESLTESLDLQKKINEKLIIEHEELKNASLESKEELHKAILDMDGYAQLLTDFENKVKEADEAKNKAVEQRDIAIEEVKNIRQKYITLLDDKNI